MPEVLVYDDEDRLVRNYVGRLRKLKAVTDSFDVRQLTNEEFEREINLLNKRQRQFRARDIF